MFFLFVIFVFVCSVAFGLPTDRNQQFEKGHIDIWNETFGISCRVSQVNIRTLCKEAQAVIDGLGNTYKDLENVRKAINYEFFIKIINENFVPLLQS